MFTYDYYFQGKCFYRSVKTTKAYCQPFLSFLRYRHDVLVVTSLICFHPRPALSNIWATARVKSVQIKHGFENMFILTNIQGVDKKQQYMYIKVGNTLVCVLLYWSVLEHN